jgi:very-short-patch-repair endonuclease
MSLKYAKKLRSNMTDAEQRLWYRLRGHRFDNVKFKRQVPIGPYIVDFACLNRNLILEIDGGQHADNERDRRRDQWLQAQGFHVLRFWNNDVLKQTNSVLEMIAQALNDHQPSSPSR